ncbi:MAG: Gfo/Idh/MocA family oxidoreductase [Puniceicoccales bacterium]|jgi:predicted dehydrogenase|nr:Gfo/Idh/MocA family oxidoreductase [Puniceicoccales bacterium]
MGKMHRRDFLRLGGAATAAAVFPSIIPSSVLGAEAPSKRINIGVVGTGGMGRSLLNGALKVNGTLLRAVCDVDRYHREQAAGMINKQYGNKDCLLFNDFRELTRRDDIDAVIVATPDHWHALPAIDAVRHGKDIYVEKPLTLTIEEGRVLVAEMRKHKRIGQTGTQQRSSAGFHKAAELIRNGHLGKISRAEVKIPANNKHCPAEWTEDPVPEGLDYDMWLGPAPWAPFTRQRTHYQFRFQLDYAGGQTTNWGAHYIDIAQWALGHDEGGPVSYEGYGEFPSTGLFTAPTSINVVATYADGTILTVRNREGVLDGTVRFHGERGWIDVSRSRLLASDPKILDEKIAETGVHLYKSRSHMGDFIECVRTRKNPISDIAIGHRTTTICNIGNIAMQLRRPLQWDPSKEEFVNDAVANRMRSRAMRAPWSLA